jgi:hypothetical protein
LEALILGRGRCAVLRAFDPDSVKQRMALSAPTDGYALKPTIGPIAPRTAAKAVFQKYKIQLIKEHHHDIDQ